MHCRRRLIDHQFSLWLINFVNSGNRCNRCIRLCSAPKQDF